MYGLDSSGLLCGTDNAYRNGTVDLSAKPNLYYLNALDLLNLDTLLYAKSVCVDECPGTTDVCNTSSLPCTQNQQYRWVGRLPDVGGEVPAGSTTRSSQQRRQPPAPGAEAAGTDAGPG